MSQVFILHFCCGVQVDRKYGLNEHHWHVYGGGGAGCQGWMPRVKITEQRRWNGLGSPPSSVKSDTPYPSTLLDRYQLIY